MPIRKTIEVPGVAHRAPIPMGAKIGPLVCSSAIMGLDPNTGRLPEDAATQIYWLFRNMETFMKEAGGSMDNVVRMSIYVRDESLRDLINKEWLQMFPDEHDRPARHVTVTNLRGGMLAQAEIIAVL